MEWKKKIRKLTKNNGSVNVNIPSIFASLLGLKPGNRVTITYENDSVVIRKGVLK